MGEARLDDSFPPEFDLRGDFFSRGVTRASFVGYKGASGEGRVDHVSSRVVGTGASGQLSWLVMCHVWIPHSVRRIDEVKEADSLYGCCNPLKTSKGHSCIVVYAVFQSL